MAEPRLQTEPWGSMRQLGARPFIAMTLGALVSVLPVMNLTANLPVEQRVLWVVLIPVLMGATIMVVMLGAKGSQFSHTSIVAAENALAELVGEPAAFLAISRAPDLDEKLRAIQGLDRADVATVSILACGPHGLAIGPRSFSAVAVQFIEVSRVDDVVLTREPTYEQWPSITATLRSRRGDAVDVELVPASQLSVYRLGYRNYQPPEADEREVRELVSAMRSTLGLSVA